METRTQQPLPLASLPTIWTCMSMIFTVRSDGGYFLALLRILHFGNAFCNSATPALVTLVEPK